MTDARQARESLEATYGAVPPVVYFIQRQENGPVKIGYTARLTRLFSEFYVASPDPVIVRAMVPGGQSLEHWFHRRHADRLMFSDWYEPAREVIADGITFAALHRKAYREQGDIAKATVATLCELDSHLADFYRLYDRGWTIKQIADAAGMALGETRALRDRMTALGFDLKPRRAYAVRG